MTQEALVTKLLSLRKRAERTAQNIDRIECNLNAEQQALEQVVKEYQAKRVELLKQELRAREMTWCTYCSKVIPENEAEFLFIEGKEKYSHGYENSYYGFRDFSKLHRACPDCRKCAADKHGQKSEYDSQTRDYSIFYAFLVEKRDDGYYARKFGEWVKLNDYDCAFGEPSSQLVEKLTEEWNLPPRIEIDSRRSGSNIVIHEPAATAEAN